MKRGKAASQRIERRIDNDAYSLSLIRLEDCENNDKHKPKQDLRNGH